MIQSNKPAFNPRIFWDVDYDQLDVDTKTEFVIVRVFERGDTPDIRKCRKYFGDQKITDTLLNTKHLSKREHLE
ncbi:DUF6922 domain-containing protein [Marinoscillum sp.]|uniref:DUF6922 domain-containing protein n=1 Tax=Marinoscillum sp. TaxID=2024838 RepID=UPI003BAD34F5